MMELCIEERDTFRSFAVDEIKIVCSLEGLKDLYKFLEELSEEHEALLEREDILDEELGAYLWHSHYQDYFRNWSDKCSDVVLELFK